MYTLVLSQYPDQVVFISYFKNVDASVISTVKSNLIAANPQYDYCFINPSKIVSREHLHCAIHKAVQNLVNNTMRAKTLNTEILFNLSPVNNIMDALKTFGLDERYSSLIVIKVLNSESNSESINKDLLLLLQVNEDQSPELTDELLWENLDLKKFKKTYKLNEVKVGENLQSDYTRLAIGACLLRGC